MDWKRWFEFLMPDPAACRAAAARLREGNPHRSAEELAHQTVSSAKRMAAGTGAVMGLAGSPLTWIPAAATDAAAVLKIEATMAGTIAALIDPEVLDRPDDFRADVLAIVFPGLASQALRVAGIRGALSVTQRMIRSQGARRFIDQAARVAGKSLGPRLVNKALLTKAVPLVGAGVGSGWNWLEVHAVGARAVAYYMHRPIHPTAGVLTGETFTRLRKLLRLANRNSEPPPTPPDPS